MEALVTSLTGGISDMATQALGAIGTVVPYMLPIVAAGIIIGVVLKTTKKVGKP